jgi:hypothetical protein
MRSTCLALLSFFLLAAPVSAQALARSFDQLQVLVRPGETIWVIDNGGVEVKGTLVAITPDRLDVQAPGGARTWSPLDVRRVRHQESDSLGNGVLWGAVVGGGAAGALWVAACASDECNSGDVGWGLLATGIYAAAGAGIGALVDLAHRSSRVVYEAPAASSSLVVAPIVGTTRTGVAIGVRF